MNLDQHFTDKIITNRLVASLLDRLDPQQLRFYIEPACGDGVFVRALEIQGVPSKYIRSVEIDSQFLASVHGDFLKTTRESLDIQHWTPATTVVIGNPPFGHNGALARKFINKASEFAHWVCMVVPRSMHNTKCCGTLNPQLALIHEEELPIGVFSNTKAKCNWQEWFLLPKGQIGDRVVELNPDTLGLYELVDKNDSYDLVVQRCGGSTGQVTTCNTTGEGKYYIRSPYSLVIEAFKRLGKHSEADKSTHQSTLSARLLHELFIEAGFRQWVSNIQGKHHA